MRTTLLSALLFVPAIAAAVPTVVTHQGRVFDQSGAPIDSTELTTFKLYDASAGGSVIWEEQFNVVFTDGYFSATLGETTPLDDSVFTGDAAYLTMAVGTGPELPTRIATTSVPYAIRAEVVDWDGVANTPASLLDGDDDTQYTAGSGLTLNGTEFSAEPYTAGRGLSLNGREFSADPVDFASLQNVPAGVADGDDVLTEAEVEGFVTNGALDLDARTTLGGSVVALDGSPQPAHGSAMRLPDDGGDVNLAGNGDSGTLPVSTALTRHDPNNPVWVHLSVNVRARYDSGDRCVIEIKANGGGYTNELVGLGEVYSGIPQDAAGHQQSSVSGVLAPNGTDGDVTFTVDVVAIDSSPNNNVHCYFGHRSDMTLVAIELAP